MYKGMLAVFAAVIGLAVGGAGAQRELVDQTLFLTYIPNVQFAPAYVALENGYFADHGIEVTIEHGDEPVGVDLIASGQRQFGIIGGEQVIAARANGRPVVFVYEWFQAYPIAVVTPAESGIQTPQDLRGRRVGVPGRFGATYTGLLALLSAAGLTERDIQLEAIGFNAPEVVCVGGVEASAVYTNNEPLIIQERARAGDCGTVTDVNVIRVADYVDLVSNGMVTNERTIAEQPELVRGMVAGWNGGARDAIVNPAAAYVASAEYVEGLLPGDLRPAFERLAEEQAAWLADNPNVDSAELMERHRTGYADLVSFFGAPALLQYAVLLETIALWDAERLGYTDPASWELTQTALLTMGTLDAPLDDLTLAYTNAFLPE